MEANITEVPRSKNTKEEEIETLHNAKPRINKQGQADSCLLAVERGAQPEQQQDHIHMADPRLEGMSCF